MINHKHSPNSECSSGWKKERYRVEELTGHARMEKGSVWNRDICKTPECVLVWRRYTDSERSGSHSRRLVGTSKGP